MIGRRRHNLVLAIYLQSHGFCYVLLEGWLAPVDWAVQDVRGTDKNKRCMRRIEAIFELHKPDVVVLQEMSDRQTRRALRLQRLNRAIAELAERRGIEVCMSSRSEVRNSFAQLYGATTKQKIAETIAKHIPALDLYIPPVRKPWMSEHARMGIFEAAALAWMHFHSGGFERSPSPAGPT
jgi:hypothetical protein